jgi:hypothetical protein
MSRTAGKAQQDRTKAREAHLAQARQRRVELDQERQARDERIDEAVADVYAAIGDRSEGQRMVEAADRAAGEALRRILAEGESMARAADLTGLSVNQLQRLKNLTGDDQSDSAIAPQDTDEGVPVGSLPAGQDEPVRRAAAS